MRVHESGAQLDTSPSRLDFERIERWLSTEAYWSLGRSLVDIVRSVDNSLVYGLYLDGVQIGLFRVVTDRTTFAWLCDVFIDREHRGKGLGLWALTHVRDDMLATGVYRILLATSDAHAIYERLGFTRHAEPDKWMELTTRRIEGL